MRIAVITGASSGMGKEFVLQAVMEEPFDEVWAIARSEERLRALQAEVPCKVRPLPLDLSRESSLEVYKTLLAQEKPEVALLVNASGFGRFGPVEEIGPEESANMVDLNCRALTVLTELTIPYMREGSKIAEFASVAAFQPVPYITVYAATKAFVLSYSRALNVELRSRGIRVMAVCPYWTNSRFFDRADPGEEKHIRKFTVMLDPAKVITKAMHDLYHTKKDVSIYGAQVRLQVAAVKLLPHRMVMEVFLRQQGLK